MSLRDFASHDEALAVADQLIKESMHEFNFEMAVMSFGHPLTDRFFYIKGKGRAKTWEKVETKSISKSINNASAKQMKALRDSGECAELLGDIPEAQSDEAAQELKATQDVAKSAGPLALGPHA